MSEPRTCPENDPLCDGVMVRPPDYPPYPRPARQPASEPASEQRAIHDLRQGIAGFVPHPNSRIMDEALDVLVAALAAARGDTP